MLLALPLGNCGPNIYTPILTFFGDEYTYVTWDYRGFFGSESPRRVRRISIPEHAQDAIEVLNACGFAYADLMVGHSMGCPVALETALLYPDAVGAYILLNGFHGHVFQTAFQPLVRVPFMGDGVAQLVELLLHHPAVLGAAWAVGSPLLRRLLPVYARVFGSALMVGHEGEGYLLDFAESYFGNLLSSPASTVHWLRLFQELDAHSVYHLLPSITQPVLLISGFFDMFIPAMQSVEIARRIPHAVHYCDPLSSHASILESPEACLAEIHHFVAALDRAPPAPPAPGAPAGPGLGPVRRASLDGLARFNAVHEKPNHTAVTRSDGAGAGRKRRARR
jgi:3-oxoadipate enol-lactonase